MTRCYRGWVAPGTTVSCLELAIKAKAEMRGEDKAKDRTRGKLCACIHGQRRPGEGPWVGERWEKWPPSAHCWFQYKVTQLFPTLLGNMS